MANVWETPYREDIEYVSKSERFVHQKNPNMVYVNAPYHDFLIKDERNIRLEVISIKFGKGINFRIRKGEWVKRLGCDFIAAASVKEKAKKVYYGPVTDDLNKFIQNRMTQNNRDKSYKPNKNGKTDIIISLNILEQQGLFRSIPRDEANKLESLIKNYHE